MSGSAKTPGPANRLSIPIRLRHIGKDHPIASLTALVDSGAAVNLMDITLAKQLGIPTTPVAIPQAVQALDGRPLGSGHLERVTVPLIMSSHNDHQETIHFWLTTAGPCGAGLPLASSPRTSVRVGCWLATPLGSRLRHGGSPPSSPTDYTLCFPRHHSGRTLQNLVPHHCVSCSVG